MKIQPVISIIIPVYNVAPYLGSCVESVLAQTFSAFELILVNDGSTDDSGSLCEAFAARDGRVRVFHIAHSGPSAARNTGLNAATGDYIGFVDADDWIEPDMYALLYKNSVSYGADLSACGFIKVYDYAHISFYSTPAASRCYTPESALREMFHKNHMRYSACNKLFRRSLFESIRYPEGTFMEDKATTYKLIHSSNRVAWCASPKYHYFMRPGSITHADFTEQELDVFAVNDELLVFIRDNYPRLTKLVRASYAAECLKLLRHMKQSGYTNAAVFEKSITCLRQNGICTLTAENRSLATAIPVLLGAAFPGGLKAKSSQNK